MISHSERMQIRQLLQAPQWQTAQHLAEEIIKSIREESVIRDTEWETVRATLEREGKIAGISHFIQELWRHAHDQVGDNTTGNKSRPRSPRALDSMEDESST